MIDVDDFDRSVSDAWRAFRSLLADHIAAMADGNTLLLTAAGSDSDDPGARCIQMYAWGESSVRCEVLSNHYLHVDQRLTAADHVRLGALGFSPPAVTPLDRSDEPSNWFVDRSRNFADEVAAAVTCVIREIWSVQHPALLASESAGSAFEAAPAAPRCAPLALRAAVTITSPEHRLELIGRTLEHMFGFSHPLDEDGDIPLKLGSAWIYLYPMVKAPFVQIIAPIAAGIPDDVDAATVVADINKRWPHVKLVLSAAGVVATIEMSVVPFVPQHLIDMLAIMENFVSEAAHQIVTRLRAVQYIDDDGNITPIDDADDDDGPDVGLPSALRTLAELVWRGGEVDIDTVLELGDHNRATLSSFLDLARSQAISANDRAECSTDRRTIRAAHQDLRVWETATALLTSAHRRLAGRQDPGSHAGGGSQLGLFGNPTENTLFD